MTFVEKLVESGTYLGTDEILDKCQRFTFETIYKCLMGDFENTAQTTEKYDTIYNAMNVLAFGLKWRSINIPLIKMIQAVPYGYTLFGLFFEQLRKGQSNIILLM